MSSYTKGYGFILCTLFLLSFWSNIQYTSAEEKSCSNPDYGPDVRVIIQEELSAKIESNGEEIWLSILGSVFDVSAGPEYYGTDGSYGFFAGRDSSPCFVTGDFNEEGAKKDIDELKVPELKGIADWRKFYEQEDKYTFVGVLEGDFYEKDGIPAQKLKTFYERLETVAVKK